MEVKKIVEATDILNRCGVDDINEFFRDVLEHQGQQKYGNVRELEEAAFTELFELANGTAAALHEDWRKGYAKANGGVGKDGRLLPRWKKIKDKDFCKALNINKLPETIRAVDGGYEIDIANTPFKNLSPDWQYENMEAAKIASGLTIRGVYGREGLEQEKVGDIIHNEWLKRNDWAVSDPVLGKPFAELPEEEKRKDLVQFEIAMEQYARTHGLVNQTEEPTDGGNGR